MKYTVKRSLNTKKIEEGQEVIFKLESFGEVETNEGTAITMQVFNYETKQPETYFCNEVIFSTLTNKEGSSFYIRNNGKKEGKKYFDFEILEIEVEKDSK